MNNEHGQVSKYEYILIISRCKYRYMYLEIKLLTHFYSNCEFTMHNIVFENLMPNLSWMYPLYIALVFLSMNSDRREHSLYQSHFSPLRNLRRQKRTTTNIGLSCIEEPILPINCVTIGFG